MTPSHYPNVFDSRKLPPQRVTAAFAACACFAVAICGWMSPAFGFNPPLDEAGPLQVRIDGPAEITARNEPVVYTLVIVNRGGSPVQGQWQIKVIDDWQVEPSDAQPFAVPAAAKSEHKFVVTPGPQTYPAHYPVHAFVRFEEAGRRLEAHPILIVEAKVPPQYPPPVAPEWRPFPLRPDTAIRLWELPIFRVLTQVVNKPAEVHPEGWSGTVEPHRGSAHIGTIVLGGVARESLFMHPPWYQGQVGTVCWEIPLRLPDTKPIALTFFAGINPEGHSDGVTFRIRAAGWDDPPGTFGEVFFEQHVVDKTWQPLKADLSALAGRAIRLQLESHPGPQMNTGWDQAYWGQPTLRVGNPKESYPSVDEIPPRRLGAINLDGQNWEFLLWPGQRGWMDAAVAARSDTGKQIRFRGFQLRVLGVRVDHVDCPFTLSAVEDESPPGNHRMRHRLETPFGPFDVLISAQVTEGGLKFRFWLENTPASKPFWHVYLEDTAIDRWDEPVWRVYVGHGNVVQKPGSFSLGFDGHRLATSFVGLEFAGQKAVLQAVDVPPMHFRVDAGGHHASLHTPHAVTMTLIPHSSAWQAVRIYRDRCGLQAAAGVPLAAGRFVFDIWGGRYRESADALKNAFRYGLTDAMVLWHNWQRWGYDYRLPEIFPPNPQLGTLEDMRYLVDTCREHGVVFGLHDNYIDFYPDAEGFSYRERIAFTRTGQPVRAWFNEGRRAQSYRFRADQVEPFLRNNLRLIKEHLPLSAYFIDVWASIEPYDYWTADGRFVDRVYTRNSWGEHFAWIRDFLGNNAPQISESGHDQLIGWLDGATANHLRVGKPLGGRYSWSVWNWPCEDAERIPWLDAAHHHRFVLHGAGYGSRYQAGLDPRLHGIYSDDYITTEILTGHPAMVDSPFGYDVVRKYWLTQPVARALALQKIDSVTFVDGDLHRQVVTWSNGGTVWVNRGNSDWTLGNTVLPPYGFLARIPTLAGTIEASMARRQGIITEMTVCPEWLYVNGRRPRGDRRAIRPQVEEVKLGGGVLEVSIHWRAYDPIPEGFRPFLHFCDEGGEIVFQAAAPADIRGPIEPDGVKFAAVAATPAGGWPSGSFELRVGWFDPRSGRRLPIQGPSDGSERIRVAHLRCEAQGGKLAAISWEPIRPEEDPILLRQNPEGRPVDFGPVVTSGGCRLHVDEQKLVVTPLPGQGSKPWDILIRWDALPWKLPRPTRITTLNIDGSRGEPQPLDSVDGMIRIVCRGETFAYELSAE